MKKKNKDPHEVHAKKHPTRLQVPLEVEELVQDMNLGQGRIVSVYLTLFVLHTYSHFFPWFLMQLYAGKKINEFIEKTTTRTIFDSHLVIHRKVNKILLSEWRNLVVIMSFNSLRWFIEWAFFSMTHQVKHLIEKTSQHKL